MAWPGEPPKEKRPRKGIKYTFRKTEPRTGRGVNKESTLDWEGRTIHIGVHIGENMHAILLAYCAMAERSLSAVVRQALREFMERENILPESVKFINYE